MATIFILYVSVNSSAWAHPFIIGSEESFKKSVRQYYEPSDAVEQLIAGFHIKIFYRQLRKR
jgi:hypothetical protein